MTRLAPLVAIAAAACSAGDSHSAGDADAGGTKDGAGDANPDVPPLDAKPDAEVCTAPPRSPDIPDGWKRFPGLPCSCDIWYTNEPEPVNWLATGPPGVLELENTWAPKKRQTYGVMGDADAGHRIAAVHRVLNDDLHDVAVFGLPEADLIFQVRIPGGWNGDCGVRLDAVGQGRVALGAFDREAGAGPAHRALVVVETIEAPTPVYEGLTPMPVSASAVGRNITAVVSPNGVVDAFTLDPVVAHPAIAAGAESCCVSAWDETLVMAKRTAEGVHSTVWDPVVGERPLLPPPSSEGVAVSCGFATDGETMIWEEGERPPDGGAAETRLYAAPFTTDRAQIEPRLVAVVPGYRANCHFWKTGGGYAAASLNYDATYTDSDVYVVRLSDGATWKIEDRPDRDFESVLYVTAEEVGLAEDFDSAAEPTIPGDYLWGVVRYPIDAIAGGS